MNINLVAFSAFLGDIVGQVFAMFVLTVAAGEAAIGLAILVIYFRGRGTIAVDDSQPDEGVSRVMPLYVMPAKAGIPGQRISAGLLGPRPSLG